MSASKVSRKLRKCIQQLQKHDPDVELSSTPSKVPCLLTYLKKKKRHLNVEKAIRRNKIHTNVKIFKNEINPSRMFRFIKLYIS